ncbi:CcmD family protein [Chitinophaga varians]|uniref:CcmD family protein n=1 Tax=Chitinophaga varians TaxID=2202339 RepID=UPI00165EFACF|nr:CcmD family protein [Chitinophaga varians]MBC9912653.1 CcmD family protein [Chitinophaga varians]
MINRAFSFCLTLTLLLVSVLANAQQQDTEKGALNEFFRSNDKIYVIVGVLVIIFLGIVLFLINLDRKISKLEQRDKK